ncbi:uncharacterized protein LOC113282858 [Papaver somniferum]|uniref:uncharacterized protein LOC113282858 n=1 Tax=Papaver somniferum TaxID=3469 RepID=UPI000E6F6AD2|nr:uncharacterized protein LOC113282858 [Papaver somniferum]
MISHMDFQIINGVKVQSHQTLYSKKFDIEKSIYKPVSFFLVIGCRIQVAYSSGSCLFERPTSFTEGKVLSGREGLSLIWLRSILQKVHLLLKVYHLMKELGHLEDKKKNFPCRVNIK